MAHDVFVSHSSKDKPTADAVCAMLESQGIRCWVAPRDITPGMDWGEAIVDAVKGARVMVLVFSASANHSPQIKREVERAVNKGIPVIPLRIEDVAPTASLEYFISTPHWLDAFTPPLETHLKYLAQIIHQVLGKRVELPTPSPMASSVSAKEPASGLPSAGRLRVQTSLLVALFFVLLMGAFAAWWIGVEQPRRRETARLRALVETNRWAMSLTAGLETNAVRVSAPVTNNSPTIPPLTNEAVLPLATNERPVTPPVTNNPIPPPVTNVTVAPPITNERPVIPPVTNPPVVPPITNETPVIPPITNERPVIPPKTNEPPVIPRETRVLTVFDLIKEANRSLGEESKDRLFYARSERSQFEWAPSTWRLGFYDPAATWKVVEQRFQSGEKIGTSYPIAVLERYNLQKVLDRKKLAIDSDKALAIVAKEPALANRALMGTEMKLEAMGGNPSLPVWTIKMWIGRLRNPHQPGEIGDIVISADDGKVIRRSYDVKRAN